ncbi:MAG TPA: RelA/SpoT family protein [Bacteroidales bacterium]|nr:RelA/SpoT family protein [Bacteroidales bacterium]
MARLVNAAFFVIFKKIIIETSRYKIHYEASKEPSSSKARSTDGGNRKNNMPEIKEIKTDEQSVIEEQFNRLLKSIKSNITPEDDINLNKAYEIAVKAHRFQRRKSGEPYILHPIEVGRICAAEIGLGPTAVICALLHDVVEDTSVSLAEIKNQFGEKIGHIVDGLTKLDGTYNESSPQAENFKKVLSTLVSDVRVVLIKMADRLHNMRTLGAMPRHKQLKIAAETQYIYAPLAHRLGLYNIKTEFQDICLRILESEVYFEIADKLRQSKAERDRYIAEFIKPLSKKLNELEVEYKITGRPKSISSIYNKIKSKSVTFEEIYDLFAIRIIVNVPREREKSVCWQVYSIVTDVHTPIPERLKDWITTPKSNGYESLHTTVIGPQGRYVEVQIRSERMDDIAERGFAAHWKYKGIQDSQSVYDNWLNNVRDLLDNNEGDALEFINDFKTNLFQDEVYVYSPKGDLIILPKGATALDFAFSIHSEVGAACTAAKVNNKLVPLGYELQNGDQVSIKTNSTQKPTENWLKMVVTGKARSKIRAALREERKRFGEYGKEALLRKFKNLKVDFESNVDLLTDFYKLNKRTDLYYEIAKGEIDLSQIKENFDVKGHLLVLKEEKQESYTPPLEDPTTEIKRPRKSKSDNKPKLMIGGEPADQYEFQLANCCNPVYGDNIFAFLSTNAGVKIHRSSCPNATHLMANYGYRILKAEWESNNSTSFLVKLAITGVDDGPGIIERLTNKISTNLGLNIRSFTIEGNEGYFEGNVSLIIENKNELEKTIRSIKKLNMVSNVTRVE